MFYKFKKLPDSFCNISTKHSTKPAVPNRGREYVIWHKLVKHFSAVDSNNFVNATKHLYPLPSPCICKSHSSNGKKYEFNTVKSVHNK